MIIFRLIRNHKALFLLLYTTILNKIWFIIYQNTYLPLELNIDFMSEIIIQPITSDGKITIPEELREKFNLKDYVEIVETHCSQGILIKRHD